MNHPDDPYTIDTHWDADGFHITVSADILPGDIAAEAEVRAEVQRRATVLRDWLGDMLAVKEVPQQAVITHFRVTSDTEGASRFSASTRDGTWEHDAEQRARCWLTEGYHLEKWEQRYWYGPSIWRRTDEPEP